MLPPGSTLGRYRVVCRIGQGGMGVVYEAVHIDLGKRVAIKTLKPERARDPQVFARFLREAQAASRLRHPHVVDVADVNCDEGLAWMVMEHLEGEDLGALLDRVPRLGAQDAADLLVPVVAAVLAAHEEGIVHRDLKPGNIFLAKTRHGVIIPKVLDFGISKLIAENKTSATATRAIGSPLWAAPEQTRTGAKLRPATDVWALGLVVFYMLTGEYYWLAPHAEGFNLPALLTEIILEPMEPASVRTARYGAAERLPLGFDAWFAR